jgi:hypothetical protein
MATTAPIYADFGAMILARRRLAATRKQLARFINSCFQVLIIVGWLHRAIRALQPPLPAPIFRNRSSYCPRCCSTCW